jgi:uncharacterized protein (DUF2141 family)
MNVPINRKSAVASTVKDSARYFHTGVRWVALFAVLVFGNLPDFAFAQTSSCPGIHVKILNIRNSTGTLDCAIFDSPVGFPTKVLFSATQVMITKILKKEARFSFEDLPPGTYALVAYHDENMNGKFDTNFIGIPKEGYGFSNDVKATRGGPSFSAATFQYDGGTLDMTITLHY